MASKGKFFKPGRKSFKDVPMINGEIATSEFLGACDSVVDIFEFIGGAALIVVKRDMEGNIKKVRDRFLSHPAESETLQALVRNEMAQNQKVASVGLLWLNRGLSFTAAALRKNVSSDEELPVSFTSAYDETLKKFHGLLFRGAISAAMRQCPNREFFYTKLSGGITGKPAFEEVKEPLLEWLTGLELCVSILNNWVEKDERLTGK